MGRTNQYSIREEIEERKNGKERTHPTNSWRSVAEEMKKHRTTSHGKKLRKLPTRVRPGVNYIVIVIVMIKCFQVIVIGVTPHTAQLHFTINSKQSHECM